MAERTPVVIDCDTGIDDLQAILYALLSPRLDVVGLTTVWGNADVARTTENTLRLLELVDRPDVPVARGAGKPMIGPAHHMATHVHGDDGIGNLGLPPPTLRPVDETAAELLVRLAHERPGELTLVAIAPMTNLGAALALDPGIARLYQRVVIMGGAFYPAWERAGTLPAGISLYGEANVWHDPEAAQAMFEAPWPIDVVPADLTRRVRLSEAMLEDVCARGGEVGRHIHATTQFYLEVYSRRLGERACCMHDAIAVGIAEDRSLIKESHQVPVDVELAGTLTRGMTFPDLRARKPEREPNATVILDAAIDTYLDRWMGVVCGAANG
jgi:purine nucleosidase